MCSPGQHPIWSHFSETADIITQYLQHFLSIEETCPLPWNNTTSVVLEIFLTAHTVVESESASTLKSNRIQLGHLRYMYN